MNILIKEIEINIDGFTMHMNPKDFWILYICRINDYVKDLLKIALIKKDHRRFFALFLLLVLSLQPPTRMLKHLKIASGIRAINVGSIISFFLPNFLSVYS